MNHPSFRLARPKLQTTACIFSSPHSGCDYSPAFLQHSVLDALTLRSSEDAFVDDLLAVVPGLGAPLLLADVPRAFLDLNRAPDELDPALVEGVQRAPHNPRVSSGIGVIPRVVSGGRQIYRGKLSLAEAELRLRTHWYPYHNALRDLIEQTAKQFGEAILIDVHSMPHEAIETHTRPGVQRPDVVLGDRFGASSSGVIVDAIESAFRGAGLHVARNAPFAGAFITQSYGRPSARRHVIQVEIDRALYMDESKVERGRNFAAFTAVITRVLTEIAQIGRPSSTALAAE